jgi:hypothetical protein
MDHFGHSGELADVNKAISALERAVYLTPDGHAKKPGFLGNLGNAFYHDTLETSLTAGWQFHIIAELPFLLLDLLQYDIHAVLRWARLAFGTHATSALQGYAIALDLQPQVVWLGKTIPARNRELATIGDISSEAAAVTISAG